MAEAQRQRLSLWGVLALIVAGIIVYFCVSSGQLLILYWLATFGLIGTMFIVFMDFGLKKGPNSLTEEDFDIGSESATPHDSPAADAPAIKRRRKRKKRR